MPSFRHKRTGKVVTVDEQDAFRFTNSRYELVEGPTAEPTATVILVPDGTVAEVLKWAGDDPDRRRAALLLEKAGKNRKGIVEALS